MSTKEQPVLAKKIIETTNPTIGPHDLVVCLVVQTAAGPGLEVSLRNNPRKGIVISPIEGRVEKRKNNKPLPILGVASLRPSGKAWNDFVSSTTAWLNGRGKDPINGLTVAEILNLNRGFISQGGGPFGSH